MRPALLTKNLCTLGLAAVLALAGTAQAAPGTELSTGPVIGGEGLGINQAIRDGEARRGGTSLSTGAPRPLAPRPEYASLPVYVGKVGDQP
ncbi:MAG TPA: hypothetical protein VJR58_07870, partial [Vineibacter sp.]|nr:hypothetical protein [Vineibacter sp.]